MNKREKNSTSAETMVQRINYILPIAGKRKIHLSNKWAKLHSQGKVWNGPLVTEGIFYSNPIMLSSKWNKSQNRRCYLFMWIAQTSKYEIDNHLSTNLTWRLERVCSKVLLQKVCEVTKYKAIKIESTVLNFSSHTHTHTLLPTWLRAELYEIHATISIKDMPPLNRC